MMSDEHTVARATIIIILLEIVPNGHKEWMKREAKQKERNERDCD